MSARVQVLIDTDVDIDDWMAILYLLKHPDVQVIGITTTGCGAAHLTPGTRNARNLPMLTAHPDTPVAAGTNAPLIYSNQFPNSIRDDIDTLPDLAVCKSPVQSPQVMQLAVAQTLDEENDTSGQLIKTQEGPRIEVAMWANANAFYERFLHIINLPDVA